MNRKHLIPITDRMATMLGIRDYDGYVGSFTRRQAKGAIPNGAAVVKIAVDNEGDVHPIGTRGVVLGSFRLVPHPLFYFVEWEPSPRLATSCIASKIRRADP